MLEKLWRRLRRDVSPPAPIIEPATEEFYSSVVFVGEPAFTLVPDKDGTAILRRNLGREHYVPAGLAEIGTTNDGRLVLVVHPV